jgi:hypothetical protein
MNERIQKLALKAGVSSLWMSGTDQQGNPILEKFAELIVRECGVALSPMLRDMVSRGQAYDLIKQHFGVKE